MFLIIGTSVCWVEFTLDRCLATSNRPCHNYVWMKLGCTVTITITRTSWAISSFYEGQSWDLHEPLIIWPCPFWQTEIGTKNHAKELFSAQKNVFSFCSSWRRTGFFATEHLGISLQILTPTLFSSLAMFSRSMSEQSFFWCH